MWHGHLAHAALLEVLKSGEIVMYRRKAEFFVLAAIVVLVCLAPESLAQGQRRGRGRGAYHPPTDSYDGWRLGMQAYTFNRFTFFEAVDKTASLGLDWIEAYPGQKLSKDYPSVKTDHNMSKEMQEVMKAKLRDAGVRLINYGVVGLSKDEAASRKVFDFAKAMGIRTIVSEPPEDAFDLIDKLCQEYEINVAIHNHPKPSRYWNPDTVLKVCQKAQRPNHQLALQGTRKRPRRALGPGPRQSQSTARRAAQSGVQGIVFNRVRAQLAQFRSGDTAVRRLFQQSRRRTEAGRLGGRIGVRFVQLHVQQGKLGCPGGCSNSQRQG